MRPWPRSPMARRQGVAPARQETDEAPAAARIMAIYLWTDSLPRFVKWASSSNASQKEKAAEGFEGRRPARGPCARRARRCSNPLRDPKADRELRHQLRLKIGASSTEEEIGGLIKE